MLVSLELSIMWTLKALLLQLLRVLLLAELMTLPQMETLQSWRPVGQMWKANDNGGCINTLMISYY